jgi:hypothetical protein
MTLEISSSTKQPQSVVNQFTLGLEKIEEISAQCTIVKSAKTGLINELSTIFG